MRKLAIFAAATTALAVLSSMGVAHADSTVQLFTSLSPTRLPCIPGDTCLSAPNQDYEAISPSFDTYKANVIQGLENGGVATGVQGTPSAFTPTSQTTFSYLDTLATSFNSWMGNLTPSAPYENEFGTYVRTSGLVKSTTAFTLADVYQSYSDPNGPIAPDSFADIENGMFGRDVFGLSYGADGVKGGGDDVFFDAANPGNASTAINELYYFGYAQEDNFCPQVCTDQSGGPAGVFSGYEQYIASAQPFDFSETVTLAPNGVTEATATFNGTISVPEPASWALMIGGIGLVGGLHRKRIASLSVYPI